MGDKWNGDKDEVIDRSEDQDVRGHAGDGEVDEFDEFTEDQDEEDFDEEEDASF